MSDEIIKLEKIRQNVIKAQQERDKLSGKKEAALEELKKLGFNSISEATKGLVKVTKEADKAAKELSKALDNFYEKYPELVK